MSSPRFKKTYQRLSILGLLVILSATPFQVFPNKDTDPHVFYLGSSWGSNLYYLGSSLTNDRGFLTSDLTYVYKNSLWVSGVLYNLPGYKPALPFYDLAAGFQHNLNDRLDLNTSLSHHQVNTQNSDTLFNSFTYAILGMGYDFDLFYSRLSVGRILGTNSQTYLSWKSSRYMRSPDFFSDRSYLTANPAINFYFGDRYKIQSHTTSGPPIVRPGMGPGGGGNETQAYDSSFGLMDLELSVPLGWHFQNFSLEAEPVYLIPIHNDPDFPSSKGFTLYISAYIRLSR